MKKCMLMAVLIAALGAACAPDSVEPCFKNLPAGCFVNKSVVLPKDQVAAIGNKLGGSIITISNTDMTVAGRAHQSEHL